MFTVTWQAQNWMTHVPAIRKKMTHTFSGLGGASWSNSTGKALPEQHN